MDQFDVYGYDAGVNSIAAETELIDFIRSQNIYGVRWDTIHFYCPYYTTAIRDLSMSNQNAGDVCDYLPQKLVMLAQTLSRICFK